jgi:Zn-dependent protease with chaperone function
MCLLLPYLVGLIALWWVIHPVEKASRDAGFLGSTSSRFEYVLFNVRHQLLIVAIPLTLIVFAYAATQENRLWFVKHVGSPWAPEAILGLTATILFILSPLLLRYIWSTTSLPPGPLREKLEALCGRINLNVRDILVWHSDGQMVNAAVMGLFPQLRYILLSDTLIEKMSDDEIESVFGHEAGHIYYHHIPYFLLFAFASMLVVSGLMEFLTRMSTGFNPAWELNRDTIQFIGMGALVPLWGICFGWISRRFERQADVYGAWCASPHERMIDCRNPCAVHSDNDLPIPVKNEIGVCSTGAQVFVGALRKVAFLNGIPPTEPSWRHSSIASRMAFLTAQSGDPIMARRFAGRIRAIKRALLMCCSIGIVIAAVYIWNQPRYRQDVIRSVFKPIGRLFGQ